jgi:hypothetical protein
LIPPFISYFMRLHILLLLLALAAGLPGRTALAQVVAPTKGGGVSIIRATATTMELSFGAMDGGQGRVLAIAESNRPVPLTVVDGQFYTGSSIYGQGSKLDNGYVIYSGPEHSITVTGLKPSTSYYFANAEYNTDGTNIMYNAQGSTMSTSTMSAPAATPGPTPLPVELIYFTGSVDANSIASLHWSTASERNSAYFALERSADGITFTEAGRVAAATASNQTLGYRWADPQPLLAPTYYRLRQVDNDGTAHYSSVITLAPASRTARLIEVYPNPSTGQAIQLLLQGYMGESLTVRVADAVGRTVMAQTVVPANAQYSEPLALPQGLAAGTYVLTLGGSSSPVQKRIIVSN